MFDDFPGTKMNDLNLDWVIKTIKNMESEITLLKNRVLTMQDNFESDLAYHISTQNTVNDTVEASINDLNTRVLALEGNGT